MSLLSIRGLSIEFLTEAGYVSAVRGLDLDIGFGEIVGLVGESGSGKSATAMAVMGILPPMPRCRVTGSIRFEGRELLGLPEREMRSIRGDQIAMIFQEPMTALNPTFTIGEQIGEVVRVHSRKSGRRVRDRVMDLLARVGIPAFAERYHDYPHQLSGGMRQRVMIAMALAAEPRLLLADEPTTALDVTVQAQILDLLRDLQEQFDLSVLLVTHSMGVVAELCNGVSVLYAGHLVESGPVDAVFAAPAHPYTRGLLLSVPEIESAQGRRMRTIRGAMPDPRAMPPGCPFAPRCDQHRETCDRGPPALRPAGPARRAACVLVGEQKEARHAAG